jgi:Cystatin domain
MKKQLQITFLLISICAFGSLSSAVSAQIKVGGFKEIAKNDVGALAAAKFAIAKKAKTDQSKIVLMSVEKAESQLVAGTNFRLCLVVEVEEKGENVRTDRQVLVQVYRNLKNVFTLSKWEETECVEDEN